MRDREGVKRGGADGDTGLPLPARFSSRWNDEAYRRERGERGSGETTWKG